MKVGTGEKLYHGCQVCISPTNLRETSSHRSAGDILRPPRVRLIALEYKASRFTSIRCIGVIEHVLHRKSGVIPRNLPLQLNQKGTGEAELDNSTC